MTQDFLPHQKFRPQVFLLVISFYLYLSLGLLSISMLLDLDWFLFMEKTKLKNPSTQNTRDRLDIMLLKYVSE